MTYSDWKKTMVQLKSKPGVLLKYNKHNAPKKRSCGISNRKCRRCGRIRAHINKYGLDLCRQCFRETAQKLGFKKYGDLPHGVKLSQGYDDEILMYKEVK